MNNSTKHIFIISILFLLMIGVVSTASAADITWTPDEFINNIDNGTDYTGYNITISSGTTNLSDDCKISASNITIKTSGLVTFNGNQNSNCFFDITGYNVTMEGITFINFNPTNHYDETTYYKIGLLFWAGENGHIKNCTFTNNHCTDSYIYGGSLYWTGENGYIENCTFSNNTAGRYGGAIDTQSVNMKITYCSFTNNAVTGYGGGGAIHVSGGSTNITYSTFSNNTSTSSGGAVRSVGNSIIQNCKFNNNSAQHGGALYMGLYDSVDNCTFTNNNAIYNGGALSGSGVYNNIIGCNFTNNTCENHGGAICMNSYSTSYYTLIKNCKFDNVTTDYGGAIYLRIGNGNIENCNFTNCNANTGGAIYIEYEDSYHAGDNCSIKDNNFVNCSDSNYGAAIYNEGHNLTVLDGSGALVYNIGTIRNPNVIIINNSTKTVAKNDVIELIAKSRIGNYTIISPNLQFVVGNKPIKGWLVDDYYFATYTVTDDAGKDIIVNASYTYGVNVSYDTAVLLVRNAVQISGGIITVPYGKKTNITLNVTSNGANVPDGTVNVTVNGNIISGDVYDGKINISLPLLDCGGYLLNATYLENSFYMSANSIIFIYVSNGNSTIDATLNIAVSDITYGDSLTVNITTNPDMTGNLTIIVNNKEYSVPVSTKSYSIKDLLHAGEYTLSVVYNGDSKYNPKTNTTYFTVKPIATRTNGSVESVSGGVIIHINTTDINGKPAEGYVTVFVNSSHNYSTFIKNGTGKLSINDLPEGHYSAVVTFNSSGNYGVSYDNCSFNITSAPSGFDLIGYNVYKEFENDTQYHAKVTDSLGNPLENMKVLVSISNSKWSKNANYTITTDKGGIATLMINLLPSDYKITAYFADKAAINNITVIATNFNLKADTFTKYFMNGTQYTVKVTDVNGNPVDNRTVTIAIYKSTWKSPAKYYAKTNENGTATLDINLIAGTYSVTANICYNSTKSSITVLPTLTASSITKKINKEANLKAKLVDNQGNPAQGKEVTFTVKDKTYYLSTDVNGVATLPIHLGLGTWSFLIANPDTGATTKATVKVTK